ncbi:MAG: serine hydrolase [Bacteroidota bacterium]
MSTFITRLLFIVFLSLLSGTTNAQLDSIPIYLNNLPESLNISIHAQMADGKILYTKSPDRRVPAASIIKVPILIELMRQAEAKQLKLKEKYTLQESDIVGGAGNIQKQPVGTTFTLQALAIEMIKESDNTATNILIRKIGMTKVNDLLHRQRLTQTSLQREMMDFAAIDKGRQNYTSAEEMNTLLKRLLNNELLSKKYTKKALLILRQCADTTTIPRYLPTTLDIAHKTGTLDYVRGDSGILFLKDNQLILSIFVENFSTFEEAEEVIGRIAKMLYFSVNNEQ